MGTDDALDPRWAAWVAGNLIRGRSVDEVSEALAGHGLPADRARSEVEAVAASPATAAAREAMRPLVMSHQLRREHLRLGSDRIAVCGDLTADEIRDRHLAPQVPVVLTGLIDDWPALRWTWEGLVERFGDVVVEVCDGRSGVAEPTRQWRALRREMTFRELVRRVLDPDTGDEVYLVANNAALDGPLGAMLDDVRPIPGLLLPDRLRPSSIWLGPAGTFTHPHFDAADTLICQILGHKRFTMAPPEEIELAERGAGYCGPPVDLDDLDTFAALGLPEPILRRTDLGPGQVLLDPAGWWHQVRSTSPALTLTFVGLPHRNDFSWFRPAPPER